jgi:hypothetical protein
MHKANKRLGMKISETDGKLCVEIDSATAFSEFEPYIENVNDISWPKPKYPIEETLVKHSQAE